MISESGEWRMGKALVGTASVSPFSQGETHSRSGSSKVKSQKEPVRWWASAAGGFPTVTATGERQSPPWSNWRSKVKKIKRIQAPKFIYGKWKNMYFAARSAKYTTFILQNPKFIYGVLTFDFWLLTFDFPERECVSPWEKGLTSPKGASPHNGVQTHNEWVCHHFQVLVSLLPNFLLFS